MVIRAEDIKVYRALNTSQLGKCTKNWIIGRLRSTREESTVVLNSISCTFSCGTRIIVGPNGSGKTTLLQVLAGLILPEFGRVTIDGRAADPLALRQVIGYLPQTFGFYPHLTGREMLHYIALLKGFVDRRTRECSVEDVLRRTGLLAVAERKVGVYSGGMWQKVGIAQALLGDPPVLLLDEPTASLDPEERNKLRGMLMELGQERVVVWTSSLIADASGAEQVLVMDQGENRFLGTPIELAACGQSQSTPYSADREADEHWSAMLEEGYRATLLTRVSR